ncbi:MAG: 2,3-bisphosphoglycerate-independent phosphoglycerate mutase [Candidatus Micrarchaeia archaeon]
MVKKKVMLVIIDGIGSLPVRDGKTEWELTRTPNLDRFMRCGVYGLMYSIRMGVIPGSDTSHLNILGYTPEKYYPGRGPLEALGAGIVLKEGEIAFRANFATVDDMFNVIDRRAGRVSTQEAYLLSKEIEHMVIDGYEFFFKSTIEHRGVLVVRGKLPGRHIEDTDPHETGKPVVWPKPSGDGARLANAITKYTKEVYKRLSRHNINTNRKLPANIVLLRGAGVYKKVEPFEKRYGMRACCIAGGALYKGIARYVGMDVIDVKGATGGYDSDLDAKAHAARELIKTYDFVMLHVKGMDNAGHDGNIRMRVNMIKKIDRMLGKLTDLKDTIMVITGDHSTPPTKMAHSHEPVPIIIYGVEARDYGARKFCEVECGKGELGRICGDQLMQLILSYSGRTEKYGS